MSQNPAETMIDDPVIDPNAPPLNVPTEPSVGVANR